MRSQFIYYPSPDSKRIKTLLLDANITSILDRMAKLGSKFQDETIRQRIKDLVGRLDKNVVILPGLGAVESVMRRTGKITEKHNYFERGANAMWLLNNNQQALKAGFEGIDSQLNPESKNFQKTTDDFERLFSVVYDNEMLPSYAVVLKAYKLYLEEKSMGRDAVSALSELELFAEELFGRGSRELFFGCLLLTGNSKGRQLALNIMKLHSERQCDKTLDCLWNTSFDLTYSRVAEMSSLPEMTYAMPKPTVFVTDDRRLGELLKLIKSLGGSTLPRGGGITASEANMRDLIDDDQFEKVSRIIENSNKKTLTDSTDVDTIQKIRKYKSKRYVKSLEDWFTNEYSK